MLFSKESSCTKEALRLTSEELFDNRSAAIAIILLVTLVSRSVLRKVSTILATSCKGKVERIPSRALLTALPISIVRHDMLESTFSILRGQE